MSDSPLIGQQQAALRELARLVEARNEAAKAADRALARAETASQEAQQRETARLEGEATTARTTLDRQYHDGLRLMQAKFQSEYGTAEQQYVTQRSRATHTYDTSKAAAKKTFNEARWLATTAYDAKKNLPKKALLEQKKQVDLRATGIEAVGKEASAWLASCRLYREPVVETDKQVSEVEDEALREFLAKLNDAETGLRTLKSLRLPRWFVGIRPVALYLGWLAVLAYPAWLLFANQEFANPADRWIRWGATAGGAALVLGTAVVVWLYLLARRKVGHVYLPLCQTLVDAERARDAWEKLATARCLREQAELKQRHEAELRRAQETYKEGKTSLRAAREQQCHDLDEKFPPLLAELKRRYEEELRQFQERYQKTSPELTQRCTSVLSAVDEHYVRQMGEIRAQYAAAWEALAADWRQGWQQLHAGVSALCAETARWFPAWDDPSWQTWTPPQTPAPVIQYGWFDVRLDAIPGATSDDPRLRADMPEGFKVPAMLPFPQRCSMLFKAGGSGRVKAVDALQAVMLRFLTGLPPGKLRFTIVDPVGLGQNFAGFMHLADYEEALVSNKIWTEPQHIEHRLADITAHMANVIQKYLRNEFENIEDYNLHAGEVAEPFRLVVIANFPFGFTDAATRHLLSIASTGARCGVYTLISVDTKLPLPHGFRLSDLEQHGVRLIWKDEAFVCKEDGLDAFPLTLDSPPPPERFSEIVHRVGAGARNANRVEVPFDFIAPPPEQWWTWSSSKGIDVPLGRAGATKRQNLSLGRGTSQHVLIAGKTGSGKSTLLHALITNLSLMYSPEEVELYLIDFKKGVEFKTYAQYQLPHARVVAIESEREFGLSVLQRLDAELKYRGDKFRDLGVQDLNGYREANGREPMPRILLLVDEFQEFFVEDDKLAQDASLLFDRLVRQGRAFGIHVHLGSQTLGGAYSLARTTLGQMAIRIALQCSETDANLILSEENSAARLLSRPGEAIYNDANGRAEGNHLFQVVFLTDDRKEDYLRRLYELAQQRGVRTPPQIVFEGNVPADIGKNHLLAAALAAGDRPPSLAPHAWLGEAIAIKDPTAAVFRRQSGANVCLIGQQPEAAQGMFVTMAVSLAAQTRAVESAGPAARFFVLDGQPPDAAQAGLWNRVAERLPLHFEVGTPRDVERFVGEIAAELERRQGTREVELPPWFLLVYDLQRFRDLRKSEDDFGFSRGDEKPTPAKQFVNILREGPGLGIHTIVWVDTLNNLNRAFERQTLREFETRVLFQMSVADSSTLIDSPSASKLGPNRALMHSEEQGRLEKFRPYSLPSDEWLARTGERLAAAGGTLSATGGSAAG